MAYYDHFVDDPEAALREIASRRNLSPQEFSRRIDAMSAEATSGRHLTLGQITAFAADAAASDRDVASHLNACTYCQGMVDAMSAEQITKNLQTLRREIISRPVPVSDETLAEQPAYARSRLAGAADLAATSGRRFSLPVATFAAILGAVVIAVCAALSAYTVRGRLASLSTEVRELSARNAVLTEQITDVTSQYLATRGLPGPMPGVDLITSKLMDTHLAALSGMKFTMQSDPVTWYAWDGNHLYVPKCTPQAPADRSKSTGTGDTVDTVDNCEMVVAAASAPTVLPTHLHPLGMPNR